MQQGDAVHVYELDFLKHEALIPQAAWFSSLIHAPQISCVSCQKRCADQWPLDREKFSCWSACDAIYAVAKSGDSKSIPKLTPCAFGGVQRPAVAAAAANSRCSGSRRQPAAACAAQRWQSRLAAASGGGRPPPPAVVVACRWRRSAASCGRQPRARGWLCEPFFAGASRRFAVLLAAPAAGGGVGGSFKARLRGFLCRGEIRNSVTRCAKGFFLS